MKKYIVLSMAFALFSTGMAAAQEREGIDPLVSIKNKEQTLKFTIGGRLMFDGGYLSSEFTPMKSGFAMTDARIRTSLSYQDWLFYADFDFSGGKFKQKNIFARYNFGMEGRGTHSLKMGYFAEPSTMSYNTSRYSYHFMNRPASVNALAAGRSLGVAYKFYNDNVLFDQGVFAENKYNDQIAGFQGFAASGRWLYRPINNQDLTLHIGASLRYARINTGKLTDDLLKTSGNLQATLEQSVDSGTGFLNAEVPWAKNTLGVGAEALFRSNRFFARGEYMYKRISKDRPDEELFENQLGGNASWATLASWQAGNPIRTSTFDGGYVEAGFLILGDRYSYDNEFGLLNGNKAKNSLEVVARYSYTNLNDINKGDMFVYGNKKFYPNGLISDYPATSTSIGGGRLHAVTVGVNYTINQYIQLMLDYTYQNLDNVYYPMDKNFHFLQGRIAFAF